jgi:hypothetical protein
MVKGGNIMFRKMFIGGGHLGFNSSVHSPIKNLVEGGAATTYSCRSYSTNKPSAKEVKC